MKHMTESSICILYYSSDQSLVREAPAIEAGDLTLTRTDSAEAFEALLRQESFDLILGEFDPTSAADLQLLRVCRGQTPQTPLIVVTSTRAKDKLVEAIKHCSAYNIVKSEYPLQCLPHTIRLIAEQGRAAQVRYESEEYSRVFFENAQDAILLTTLDGSIFAVNPAACQMFGRTAQEIKQVGCSGLMDMTDPQLHAALQERACSGQSRVAITMLRSDGSTFPADIALTLFIDAWGEKRTSLVIRDITAQKKIIEALEQSQKRLSRAQEIGHLGHWDWDIHKETLFWSDELYRIFGLERNFLLTYEPIETMIHPDDRALNSQYVHKLLTADDEIGFEFRIVRSDGQIRHIAQTAQVVRDQTGQPIRAFGIMQDITIHRQTEQSLGEMRELYRNLFEQSPDAVFILDLHGRHIEANHRAVELLGYSRQELLARSVQDISAQLDESLDIIGRLLAGELIPPYERLFRHRNGHLVPVELHVSLIYDHLGQPRYIQSIAHDITDHIQAEQSRQRVEKALRESEARYRLIAERVNDIVWQMDASLQFVYVSPAVERVLGYTPQEASGLHVIDLLDQDGLAQMQKIIQARLGREVEPIKPTEYRMKHKDGHWVDVEVVSSPLHGMEGHPMGFVGITRDITERKQFEEKMRLYMAMFECSKEAIAISDPQGRLLYINPAHEKLFGCSLAQAQQMNYRDFYPPHSVDILDSQVVPALARGETWEGNIEAFDASGRLFPLWERADSLRDANGNVLYTFGFMHDITFYKQEEESLRASREQLRALASRLEDAREVERAHIAREIHDEFGQSLTALKIDLVWLEKRLFKETGLVDKVKNMIDLIDNTIQQMRHIATELRPGLLDDLGLVAAIEWQALDFAHRTGIDCLIDLDQGTQDMIDLDRNLATAVFRIFQEALTNVARHAQASKVSVTLRQIKDVIILTVHDNGRGLPADAVTGPHALGLLGMQERASFWQGSVTFESESGQGTIVTLHVPYLVDQEVQ